MPESYIGTDKNDEIFQDFGFVQLPGEMLPIFYPLAGDDYVGVYKAIIEGGGGNNTYEMLDNNTNGFSILSFRESDWGVTINLLNDTVLNPWKGIDTIKGYFPQIWGSRGNDAIYLDDRTYGVVGMGGADLVVGGASLTSYILVADIDNWSISKTGTLGALMVSKVTGESIETRNIIEIREFSGRKFQFYSYQETSGRSSILLGTQANKSNFIPIDESNGDSYHLRSAFVMDINDDGNNEALFTLTRYPNFQPLAISIYNTETEDIAADIFKDNTLQVLNSEQMVYTDLNNDSINDLVFSDTGFDRPPWYGASIKVALGSRDGFVILESPELTTNTNTNINPTRNYGIAVGDFNGDGQRDIFAGASEEYQGNFSKILNISEDGVATSSGPLEGWADRISGFPSHLYMHAADFDKDGFDDLLLSGSWSGPNNQIIFGSKNGLNVQRVAVLPSGPLGQAGYEYFRVGKGWPLEMALMTPETKSIVEDFNNDGFVDVFSTQQEFNQYPPFTIENTEVSNFDEIWSDGGGAMNGYASYFSILNLEGDFSFGDGSIIPMSPRHYDRLIACDVNRDGYKDVIGGYFTFPWRSDFASGPGTIYGTTFFINDGQGGFSDIDAMSLIPELASSPSIGFIIPLKIMTAGLDGIQIYKSEEGDGYILNSFHSEGFDFLINSDFLGDDRNNYVASIATYCGIDGAAGIDTSAYSGPKSNFELRLSGQATWQIKQKTLLDSSNLLEHELRNVERLKFDHISVALDVSASGNAGQARLFIGTIAHALIDNPGVEGTILYFFDQGMSMQQVCQLAVDVNLISALAGSSSNADLARLVWRNVVGVEADNGAVDLLVSFMDGRNASFSQAELLATAAQLSVNQEHVGLTGLASTGMEYLPFEG